MPAMIDESRDSHSGEGFFVANKRFVADDFEDETVVIDVDKGLYFSLQGSAVPIWRLFQDSQNLPAVLDEAARALPEDACLAVRRTIDDLIAHRLLLEAEPAPRDPPRLDAFAAAFSPPVFQVFSDLADLITIDPVHEVDEAAGWPVRPAKPLSQA